MRAAVLAVVLACTTSPVMAAGPSPKDDPAPSDPVPLAPHGVIGYLTPPEPTSLLDEGILVRMRQRLVDLAEDE